MNRKILLSILTWVIVFGGIAWVGKNVLNAPVLKGPPLGKKSPGEQKGGGLTIKQWQEDLNEMLHFIKTTHPNPFTRISEKDFDQSAQSLYDRIPDMGSNQIVTEFLRISTSIRDGHTNLYGKDLTTHWFPIRIEEFEEGFFITVTQPELKKFIGKRVSRINGLAVEKVFEMIKSVGTRENEYASNCYAPLYLMMERIVKGLGIMREDESCLKIQLTDMDSDIRIHSQTFDSDPYLSWFSIKNAIPSERFTRITDIKKDHLPLYLQNFETPYWYHDDIQNSLIYFGFNQCQNVQSNPFKCFNKQLWDSIDEHQIEYLVIDLRHNIGGTNTYLLPLLHQIIKHDRINRKEHLFIIIGNKTWSAAIHLAAWIEVHCNATFIGQPTGAPPNHFADPQFTFLPNSKIMLMASRHYWQTTGPTDERNAIYPEIKILKSADAFFGYRDLAMERILQLVHSARERGHEK